MMHFGTKFLPCFKMHPVNTGCGRPLPLPLNPPPHVSVVTERHLVFTVHHDIHWKQNYAWGL